MKSKTEIALELLKVIQSLGLSPAEVKILTLEWIKTYPFVLEDFGWDVQIHVRVHNISAEVQKLQALLSDAEQLEAAFTPPEPDEEPQIHEPVTPISETEVVPKIEAPPVDPPTPQVELPAEPVSLTPKGYSKYGKKLGRPKKQRSETAEKPTSKSQADKKAKPAAKPKPKPAAPIAESSVALKPVDEAPPTEEELIERLKFGKPYTYDLLYLVKSAYVRSPFKLRNEAGVSPVGVVIPYTHQNEPYEIVVYYTDETAAIPLNTAQKYAKNKLLPYKEVSWRVKEAGDDAHIRPVLSEINEIFKKMGGDAFKGNYIDGRGGYYGQKVDLQHKIRYVCDIPLSKKEQSD